MPDERILIVDDDREIVRLLRSYLQQERYAVSVAYDGESALHALRRESPALVLLDLMLPDKDGWEITRTVRGDEQLADTLIIMLTARVEDTDKIVGLELGADDYVTKPFNPREVVARVRALLRRTQRTAPRAKPLVVGSLQMDVERRNVQVRSKAVELTPTEFSLLQTLMESPGYVFTRSELMDKALGYDYDGVDRMLGQPHQEPAPQNRARSSRAEASADGLRGRLQAGRRTEMNRLWVRLSLAFAAIIIISFGAISYTARRYLNEDNLRSMILTNFVRPVGLVDRLEEYYAGHGSWEGVSPLLEGADSALFFNATNRRVLVLTDADGGVLYATAGADNPARLEASQLQQSLPHQCQRTYRRLPRSGPVGTGI